MTLHWSAGLSDSHSLHCNPSEQHPTMITFSALDFGAGTAWPACVPEESGPDDLRGCKKGLDYAPARADSHARRVVLDWETLDAAHH
jgi:hypothetical protein